MKRLARNVITTYVARFANVIGLFFLFPLVSNAVPQAEYGVYLLTASLVSIFVLDLGMAGSTTRFVSIAIERSAIADLRSVMATSWLFFLGLGAVGACAVVASVAVSWAQLALTDELKEVAFACTAFAAAQVLFSSALSPNRLCLAGAGRIDVSNVLQIGQIVLRFLLTAGIVSFAPDIVWVSLADLATVVAAGGLSWVLRRRMVSIATTSIMQASRAQFRQMFGLTRDFLVMNIAALVVLQAGNVIVALLLAPVSIAIFAAAQRIYQVARELTNSLTAALLPAATANHAADRLESNSQLFLLGTKYSNALLAAVLPPVLAFMPALILAWIGVDYSESVLPALILVASMFVNNQHLVAVPILGGQGDLRAFSAMHAIWAMSAIALGWWLTGLVGVAGMAIAIALPLLLLEPFYVRVALRRLSIKSRDYLRATLLPAFLPALCLLPVLVISRWIWPAPPLIWVLIMAVTWTVLYLSIYILFGMSRGERATMLSLVGRSTR